jgi:hypothetical protein
MNYFLFFIGIIILLITAADLINTSLSVRGAGYYETTFQVHLEPAVVH